MKKHWIFFIVSCIVLFALVYIQVNPRNSYVEEGDTLHPYSYSSGQLEYDERAERVTIRVSIESDAEFDVYLMKGTGVSPFIGLFPPPRIRHGVAGGDDLVWELDRDELNGSDISLLLENLHWGDRTDANQSIHYSMDTVVVSHLNPLIVPMFWIAIILVVVFFTLIIMNLRRRSMEGISEVDGTGSPGRYDGSELDGSDLEQLNQP